LEDNLLYQFQYIFSQLKESAKKYINPKDFCKANKDWDGNPINVREQQDAEEFFNSFVDKIETQIESDPQKDLFKQYFGGICANEIIG
jgi:ubiquitin C-terminal hydrolase